MNLKLLEKLVKLATNNPNENEANSAARRACKLIVESDFKFVADIVKQEPKATKVASTWSDVTRSTEPMWRAKPPNQSGRDIWEEFFGGKGFRPNKAQEDFFNSKRSPFVEYKEQREKPVRPLKCRTCGQIKETIFQGLDQMFECNECQWSEWTKNRNKETPR